MGLGFALGREEAEPGPVVPVFCVQTTVASFITDLPFVLGSLIEPWC